MDKEDTFLIFHFNIGGAQCRLRARVIVAYHEYVPSAREFSDRESTVIITPFGSWHVSETIKEVEGMLAEVMT